ncbi:MAG: energy transducer TonB [Sulfurospirillaceae bacterium]|nr:energy transducer TonB [Sulfurospirillaceae bacterium]
MINSSSLYAFSLQEVPDEMPVISASIEHRDESMQTIVIAHHISSKEELLHYVHYVEEVVQEHKFYPRLAKTMGHEGRCILQFSIKRDGTIDHPMVLEPTFSTLLNQAALEILERIGTFKSFPMRLKNDSVLINIPIRYTLQGS